MDKFEELEGTKVVIVADDSNGYGKKTEYVGQRGTIIGWRFSNKIQKLIPVIELESGEVISTRNIWWDSLA